MPLSLSLPPTTGSTQLMKPRSSSTSSNTSPTSSLTNTTSLYYPPAFNLNPFINNTANNNNNNTMINPLVNQSPLNNKLRILCIFSSPRNSSNLRLHSEERLIRDSLTRSQYRDYIELYTLPAATLEDVSRALLERDYHIIQFSGHAVNESVLVQFILQQYYTRFQLNLTNDSAALQYISNAVSIASRSLEFNESYNLLLSINGYELNYPNLTIKYLHSLNYHYGGLVFESDSDTNGMTIVNPIAFAQLIAKYNQVQCVILNACHSFIQGELLIQNNIPTVICTPAGDRVTDSQCLTYSVGFYDSIAAGRSLLEAFNEGNSRVQLKSLSTGPVFTLLSSSNNSSNILSNPPLATIISSPSTPNNEPETDYIPGGSNNNHHLLDHTHISRASSSSPTNINSPNNNNNNNNQNHHNHHHQHHSNHHNNLSTNPGTGSYQHEHTLNTALEALQKLNYHSRAQSQSELSDTSITPSSIANNTPSTNTELVSPRNSNNNNNTNLSPSTNPNSSPVPIGTVTAGGGSGNGTTSIADNIKISELHRMVQYGLTIIGEKNSIIAQQSAAMRELQDQINWLKHRLESAIGVDRAHFAFNAFNRQYHQSANAAAAVNNNLNLNNNMNNISAAHSAAMQQITAAGGRSPQLHSSSAPSPSIQIRLATGEETNSNSNNNNNNNSSNNNIINNSNIITTKDRLNITPISISQQSSPSQSPNFSPTETDPATIIPNLHTTSTSTSTTSSTTAAASPTTAIPINNIRRRSDAGCQQILSPSGSGSTAATSTSIPSITVNTHHSNNSALAIETLTRSTSEPIATNSAAAIHAHAAWHSNRNQISANPVMETAIEHNNNNTINTP